MRRPGVFYRLANEHAQQLVADALFQAEHSIEDGPRHHQRPAGGGATVTSQDPHDKHSQAADHDHRHGHHHPASQWHGHLDSQQHPTGIRGFLYMLFVPHTHDPHDSIDDALEASEAGIRAVKISLLGLAVTPADGRGDDQWLERCWPTASTMWPTR